MVILVVILLLFSKRKGLQTLTTNTLNFIKQKTWDIVSDRRIRTLHPLVQDKAKEFIIRAERELGIKLRVTSALRTWEEQSRLYNQGRSAPGRIVTYAKAGESYHNYGLAFDVVEIKNGRAIWKNPNWQKIGDFGKALGFEWGGDWQNPDRPHFQMRFGKHHTELAQAYRLQQKNG